MKKSAPGGWTCVPSVVGTAPTNTNPRWSTPSPSVSTRPGKPGNGDPWKNVVALPACPAGTAGATTSLGVSLMIVVPVPGRLLLLLKLDTSISPGAIPPSEGKPCGTIATP